MFLLRTSFCNKKKTKILVPDTIFFEVSRTTLRNSKKIVLGNLTSRELEGFCLLPKNSIQLTRPIYFIINFGFLTISEYLVNFRNRKLKFGRRSESRSESGGIPLPDKVNYGFLLQKCRP